MPPRWVFVKIKTSDGTVGWGEGTLEGHTEAVEGAFFDLRERFVGADPDNIQDIWQIAYRSRFYRGGPVLMVGHHLFGFCTLLFSRNFRADEKHRSPECSFWAGYCALGHKRKTTGRANLAVTWRQSEGTVESIRVGRRR